MELADKTITCYVEQQDETYKRWVIHGVSWREKTAVTATDKGLTLNNFVTIRIPLEQAPQGFVPTKETLVILGECSKEIGENNKVAALKRTHHGKIVKSIHMNTDGRCPHWKLEGV